MQMTSLQTSADLVHRPYSAGRIDHVVYAIAQHGGRVTHVNIIMLSRRCFRAELCSRSERYSRIDQIDGSGTLFFFLN